MKAAVQSSGHAGDRVVSSDWQVVYVCNDCTYVTVSEVKVCKWCGRSGHDMSRKAAGKYTDAWTIRDMVPLPGLLAEKWSGASVLFSWFLVSALAFCLGDLFPHYLAFLRGAQ